MKMSKVAKLLDGLIHDAGLDYATVSKRLDRNHAYIHQFVKKGTPKELPEDIREGLADIFGVPPDMFRNVRRVPHGEEVNATVTFQPSTYPIIEYDVRAQGGAGALLDDHSEHRIVDEWRLPRELIRGQTTAPAERLVIGRIYGDSMEPTYRAGDRVLIDTSDCVPSPSGVFFVYDVFALVCKHVDVVPYSDPPMLKLKPENPFYETYTFPVEDVVIQGRVIGKWEWK